ncbi:immunity 49 family protein [Nocardiopsis sp. HNM0947]|uniref:Immunity 49 family protein n=1 Tax=Nocardiopsis coralli TaxID=2772213 RepID=A0ABR9P8J2_9ACTN|nr:immunity 49 family protein [Nocardiopsis coralli]MBE3000164.1 immunity 49 family protein [Nocardiopsis coralli]
MSLRIERHEVGEEALTEATENFNTRIARQVDMQEQFDRSDSDWGEAALMLSAYAGARSVQAPNARTDIKVALHSAAEAEFGALLLSGLPSSAGVDIALTYTGTGICYESAEGESGPEETDTVTPLDWTSTFYSSIISDQTEDHRSHLVRFVRDLDGKHALPHALASYLYPEMGLGRKELETYVRNAVERAQARSDHESSRLTPVQRRAEGDLVLLNALLSGDQEAFWARMRARLERYPEDDFGAFVPVQVLLPTTELAFAALAVRIEGWQMPFETDYLPRYLVEAPGAPRARRVGAFGGEKDPDSVDALAAGPIVVERPEPNPDLMPRAGVSVEEQYRRQDKAMADLIDHPHLAFGLLPRNAAGELTCFRFHSFVDPQARDPRQLAALTHASQYSAAKFACVSSASETEEVTIGENTVALQTFGTGSDTSESALLQAVEEALLSGSRARLEALLDLPEGLFRRGNENGPAYPDLYRRAFLAYLREQRARGWLATSHECDEVVRAELDAALGSVPVRLAPDEVPFSGVLFSQIVAGDEEGFNLALADRLEEHREAYSFGRRLREPKGLVATHVLALACLARAKGWAIRVESDYLPDGVLERAAGMFH